MDSEDLKLFWNQIQKPVGNEYNVLRINAECLPELSVGFNANGNYCLFLFLIEGPLFDFNGEKFEHFKTEYVRQNNCIIIELLDVFYIDIFLDLIISLFFSIKDVEVEMQSTKIFIEKINLWSTFFVKPRNRFLKEDVVKGIIGELIFLNHLILNREDKHVNDILNSWKGPYNNIHDFELDNKDVEVKAKSFVKEFVKISSEFQLETQNGKGLELLVISLDRSGDGVLCLEYLVNDIRAKIIYLGGDLTIFLNCLKQYGLTFLNLDIYNGFKFTVRAFLLIDITSDNFPKINSCELANGISHVRYRLYLNNLEEFVIQEINPYEYR